jgi:hypothetical protein
LKTDQLKLLNQGLAKVEATFTNRLLTLEAQLGEAQAQTASLQESLASAAARYQAFEEAHRQQTQAVQAGYEEQAQARQQAHAERESELQQQLQRAAEDLLHGQQAFAGREQELSAALQAMQEQAAAERAQAAAERERSAAERQAFEEAHRQQTQAVQAGYEEQAQARQQAHAERESELQQQLHISQVLLEQQRQDYAQQEQAVAQILSQRAAALQHRLDIMSGLLTNTACLASWCSGPALYGRVVARLEPGLPDSPHGLSPLASPPHAPEPDMTLPQPMTHLPSVTPKASAVHPFALDNFVLAADREVLGREPDSAGLAFYRARLREGVSKLQVLGEMAAPVEFEERSVALTGLEAALNRHFRRTTGWLGKLTTLIGKISSYGEIDRRFNRQEVRMQEETARVDIAIARLDDYLARLEACLAAVLVGRTTLATHSQIPLAELTRRKRVGGTPLEQFRRRAADAVDVR